jgi:lipoprotein NlpD
MRALLLVGCTLLASCSGFWRWDHDLGERRMGDVEPPTRTARPAARAGQTYTVKAGDTLYRIAIRHGLDYHDLAVWNGIGSDYRLDIGQVLRLSPKGSVSRPLRPGSGQASGRQAAPRRSKADVARTEPTLEPRPAGAPPSTATTERYYQWQWPLSGAIAKTYSPEGGSKGLDIGGELGQAVIAAAPGRVVYSGSGLKGYGELVIIKHDETYLSAYGYNRKRLVDEGELVTAGQAIAELGPGPEQKPLLHFEIREHGKPLDPLPLLPKIP